MNFLLPSLFKIARVGYNECKFMEKRGDFMVQNLFSQNILIYIYAGLCGLGLFVRFILELIHIRLISETDNLSATKNKTLKHMKMKFETCYKLKIGVNNVDTFVDKNILRYRFCGILLSTWENFSGQVLLLSFLIVPVSTVFGVIFDCGQDEIINAGAVGILTGSILILVDRIVNLSTKKRVIRLNLMDYLENFCKVRLEQEAFRPELLEQYRKEYFQAFDAVQQISSAAEVMKDDSKSEINRRREARLRKEEDKRALQRKREAEQKKIEEARKEQERKKLEERKRLAAKRREEELLKLEEEREALERRRAEMKKRAEEKQQMSGKKQKAADSVVNSIQRAEEEFAAANKKEDIKQTLADDDETAAELEAATMGNISEQANPLTAEKSKTRPISPQEEKLIEDILKEFFA